MNQNNSSFAKRLQHFICNILIFILHAKQLLPENRILLRASTVSTFHILCAQLGTHKEKQS